MSRGRRPQPIEGRFDAKVNRTETCWLWTAQRVGTMGYGRIWLNGRGVAAHRYSYERFVGPIPAGMQVLHKCDNPVCVRPDHLFLGTQLENMQDKIRKGRGADRRGERAGTAKLSTASVARMRALRSEGWTTRRLAEEFGISRNHCWAITHGKHCL
jgi:hypothetical protein